MACGVLLGRRCSDALRIMDSSPEKPPTVEVGEGNFDLEVLGSRLPVLVAFGAHWSRPCRILESTLDEVACACAERVKVAKVNADDNPDLSICYEVQSIPTLLYFVEGKLCAKIVGTASKEAILSRLQTVLPRAESDPPPPEVAKEHELRNG